MLGRDHRSGRIRPAQRGRHRRAAQRRSPGGTGRRCPAGRGSVPGAGHPDRGITRHPSQPSGRQGEPIPASEQIRRLRRRGRGPSGSRRHVPPPRLECARRVRHGIGRSGWSRSRREDARCTGPRYQRCPAGHSPAPRQLLEVVNDPVHGQATAETMPLCLPKTSSGLVTEVVGVDRGCGVGGTGWLTATA